MTAYYNEIDPFAAQWLRDLIKRNLIAPGDVDERSIEDVNPADLFKYTQCHFFAGIGGWSRALRLAEWPDDRPVWTGSCPCQPFSSAGSGAGFDDERHLWPAFFHLIGECRPGAVFGEQVASPDALAWLDVVQTDLEGADYAVGATDLCAAGVGAPHIRQRLYWVADSHIVVRGQRCEDRRGWDTGVCAQPRAGFGGSRMSGRVGDADGDGRTPGCSPASTDRSGGPIESDGYWSDVEWVKCYDGKLRPIKPGLSPLAYGIPTRVGRIRGYGNAIVPPLAAEFVKAYCAVRS